MKRRMLSLAAALMLVLSLSVQAAETRAVQPVPRLTFSGTTATCFASCRSGYYQRCKR